MIKMLEIRILVERHVEIGLIAYIHMISVLKWTLRKHYVDWTKVNPHVSRYT